MKSLLLTLILASVSIDAMSFNDWETAIAAMNEMSIPLINIDVNVITLNKEQYIPGKITIYDTSKRINGEICNTFDCKIKFRGASALKYEKKSFAVKLLNSVGNDLDVNIFNIRKENDWILDAMTTDRIRMRNRVCFDIWNEISKTPYPTVFDNRNGTKGEYIELYLNGTYHGLYCMSDKIDRKLLGLKKVKENTEETVTIRGVLYKGTAWSAATQFAGYDQEENMESDTWNGWELQYPDDYPCYEAWHPIQNIIDCCKQDLKTFENGYRNHFYTDNLTDYMIFLMSLNIIDNNMKNTHLSCPNIQEEQMFLITPWDLDCSLGGLYDGSRYEEYTTLSNLINNRIYYFLYNGNVNEFQNDLKRKWSELSSNILTKENVFRRLDKYAEKLKESGAWQREYDKWNNNPVPLNLDEELQYVKKWYARNIIALDKIFQTDTYIKDVSSVSNKKKTDTYTLDGIKRGIYGNTACYIIGNRKVIIKR